MITQSYLGKKLTYGYQGQKYGFQDKNIWMPIWKERFAVQKLCCCIFYAYMNGTGFPFCRTRLSTGRLYCDKFTCKFYKTLHWYHLY